MYYVLLVQIIPIAITCWNTVTKKTVLGPIRTKVLREPNLENTQTKEGDLVAVRTKVLWARTIGTSPTVTVQHMYYGPVWVGW